MTNHQRERLTRITERAQVRYDRRRAAVDWFWADYNARRWGDPKLISRVKAHLRYAVPALRTSPQRQQYICYEDCLHVADQAFMLLNRLVHAWITTRR